MNAKRGPLRLLHLLFAAVVPFLLTAGFIVVTREYLFVPGWLDWFGLLGAVATGAHSLWRLHTSWSVRVIATCAYVPVIGWLVFCFWLAFVGSRYGLWL